MRNVNIQNENPAGVLESPVEPPRANNPAPGAKPDFPIREEWTSADGQHRILWGDSLKILPTLDTSEVAAVLADPQYGLGDKWTGGTWFTRNVYETDKVTWDDKPSDIRQILALNIPTILWGGNYLEVPPSRCWLSWAKRDNMPTMADFELAWTNLDRPAKEMHHRRNGFEREHPTQKPVALMTWCLSFLPPGLILDPYAGSCTVAVACARTGRRSISIEIEERYFRVGIARMEREAARHPLLEPKPLRQKELL
jgi:DNA modification methylase